MSLMPSEETDTRARLLVAARKLFAEEGYEGVSLRSLTAEAGVNLAAVNYHFGSKRDLFMAMLREYIEPVNAERARMLASVRRRQGRPELRGVIEALIKPMIMHADGEARVDVFRIAGRCITAPTELDEAIFREFFQDIVSRFQQALGEALPDLPEPLLRMRFHFMVSSMLGVMVRMSRILDDPGARALDVNAERVVQEICDFLTAAMRAPQGRESREVFA